jgi:TonB family protein
VLGRGRGRAGPPKRLATALLWAAWLPGAAALAQPGQADVAFDIPAQPVSGAVEAFAAATHIQVLYDRPLGPEPRSPGVRGRLSPQAALAELLVGTGLEARFTDPRDAVLAPAGGGSGGAASAGSPPDLPSLALGTLHVEGPSVLEAPAHPIGAARRYGEVIKSEVADALARDARTSKAPYSVGVSLWISGAGAVRKAEVSSSSGRRDLDAAITTVLERLVIGEPPPPDLPAPVQIRITSHMPG